MKDIDAEKLLLVGGEDDEDVEEKFSQWMRGNDEGKARNIVAAAH